MLAPSWKLVLFALLAFHPLARGQATQDEGASKRGLALDDVEESSSSAYGRRHALVIGIDEYEDAAYPDLGYAVADARAVAKILIESYGFESEDVRLVVNEDATQDTLEEALEEWACDPARVGEEDLFVLFFAGHGVTRAGRRESRGYIVPVDGESESNGSPSWSSLIGMNDVEDISELVPAKHALFVLDCCFGGLAVTRAAPPVAAGLSNRARQVITAGNAQQAVLDAGGGGHSVFTGALLDGLEGDADLDGDQVVTFGELFNHVGREVERRTEKRQTPLQATFPDHEGGNVALFAPDVKPGTMSAAQRLKGLERTAEEQLAEVKRLSDTLLTQDLVAQAAELWPAYPEMIPRYRDWIDRARALVERKALHDASLRQVRQEAYLSQVVSGQLEEGEGSDMDWNQVDPELRWRHQTFTGLVTGLEGLEAGLLAEDASITERGWSVPKRLAFAEDLRASFAEGGEYDLRWKAASSEISAAYPELSLGPQMGLIPLGADPYSGLWEFWHVQSGAEPQRGADGGVVMEEHTGLVFVLLPGGQFWMGVGSANPNGRNYDPDAIENEGPVHEVELSAFFLSKYEMTQGQWERMAGVNPSRFTAETFNGWIAGAHPVEQVSWLDCMELLPTVDLELPSEAQWEYGSRAGSSTPRPFAFEDFASHANIGDLSYKRGFTGVVANESWDDGMDGHGPVGRLLPNDFGLYDVIGNVWEWCLDGFDPNFYGSSPATDPVSPFVGSATRVYRGGGCSNAAVYARSANRYDGTPTNADYNLGVRPARVITD